MKNLIRFDWAIKRLLRNKANFGILEGFLSELLEEDIKFRMITSQITCSGCCSALQSLLLTI